MHGRCRLLQERHELCSMRTPQASGHIFLKTFMSPEAAGAVYCGPTCRRGL